MKTTSAHHATIVFERNYDVPIERVFGAFADPKDRARWSAPSDTAVLIYDKADFRIGGRDTFRCGAKSDPKFFGESRYHDIIPNRRIVSSETIDTDGKRLSVALTTMDLEPEGSSTKVKLTVQIVLLDGADMIEGTKIGYTGALDNLARELERSPTSA